MLKFISQTMIMYVAVALCMFTVVGGKIGEYLLVTDEVSMDVSIGGQPKGTFTIGLFGETVPKTVANFVALANHTYGYGYQGSKFYYVNYGWAIVGGDFEYGNGLGGYSIYGKYFADESFEVEDDGHGWMFMDNQGVPDTNSAAFIITLYNHGSPTDRGLKLAGKHVGFGRITKGLGGVVDKIANVNVKDQKMFQPNLDVIITNCGVNNLPVYKRYWIENQQGIKMLPLDMVKGGGGEMRGVVWVGLMVIWGGLLM